MQVTRERVVRWEDPHIALQALRGLSGLEAMRAVQDGRVPAPPIAVLMGFHIAEVEAGRVTFVGDPAEEHYNPIGGVHGGFALTLFDSALGCAIHTLLEAGVGYSTTDTHVRFIRGMTKDTGLVRCEATAVHVGRSTAVAEAKLYDAQRRLLGIGTTGCAILRR